MSKLLHLPNINQHLEQKLVAAGIETPEMLREKGSRNVFLRVKMIDSSACFDMLLALEGAVRGILIEDMDEQLKVELKEFMEIFNQ